MAAAAAARRRSIRGVIAEDLALVSRVSCTLILRAALVLLALGIEWLIHEAIAALLDSMHLETRYPYDILNNGTLLILVAVYGMLAIHTVRTLARILLAKGE